MPHARASICGIIFCVCLGALGEEPAPDEFARALKPYAFSFPKDFGAHPRFRTEWWYVTGELETENKDVIGYQATWFRTALQPQPLAREASLAARDLFFFHSALSDVARQKFSFEHKASRGASTWAGADEGRLRVFFMNRTLERVGENEWRLLATIDGRKLELTLTPERAPLLHGEKPGLSPKGPEPGQASHYVSLSRLRSEGTLERAPGEAPIKVHGRTWFDQEFGSGQLAAGTAGWDWFSVALDDGSDLMLYRLRKEDAQTLGESSGTYVSPEGARTHLPKDAFQIEVLDTWTSPHTNAKYPASWKISAPGKELDLEVRPLLPDQELLTTGTTGVNYWEGLCEFTGKIKGRAVHGRGYVELVGYAGKFIKGL